MPLWKTRTCPRDRPLLNPLRSFADHVVAPSRRGPAKAAFNFCSGLAIAKPFCSIIPPPSSESDALRLEGPSLLHFFRLCSTRQAGAAATHLFVYLSSATIFFAPAYSYPSSIPTSLASTLHIFQLQLSRQSRSTTRVSRTIFHAQSSSKANVSTIPPNFSSRHESLPNRFKPHSPNSQPFSTTTTTLPNKERPNPPCRPLSPLRRAGHAWYI